MLLRDLGRKDDEIDAIIKIIATVEPDVLLLTDVDYDHDHLALTALQERFYDVGLQLPHSYTAAPNSGLMTTLDLDQNGKFGEPRDAQGYGRYPGNGGMALFARWDIGEVVDYTDMLWQDLPGATLPADWPTDVLAIQRLSSVNHWHVEILHPDGPVSVMAFSATPPVFDGPEDRNGLRNQDELALWSYVLDTDPKPYFVVLGNANLDPVDGDGLTQAMKTFLADPRLQDPKPSSAGGGLTVDPNHNGNPKHDTADWDESGPGNLRVSYVLPSHEWTVTGAGVFWPAPDDPNAVLLGDDALAAGPHRLVWVDVSR